ncbi:hypothetical protein NVP1244A_188 [Vibrio phage 1.244.A._10N.261.54.C3]|nr:hypothetical protein NVP1244A_188 [Vibrio phage 1.244.A._10N.261.54.C3]AUR98816.1 hypothetical protein NVP1255O_188 [Vibrio phage 1.255.O._10N.286.45.F1]
MNEIDYTMLSDEDLLREFEKYNSPSPLNHEKQLQSGIEAMQDVLQMGYKIL